MATTVATAVVGCGPIAARDTIHDPVSRATFCTKCGRDAPVTIELGSPARFRVLIPNCYAHAKSKIGDHDHFQALLVEGSVAATAGELDIADCSSKHVTAKLDATFPDKRHIVADIDTDLIEPSANAIPDMPEVDPILGVVASATSSAKKTDAWYALGPDPTKYWCEGRADEGTGEALVLDFSAPVRIDYLTIRAGVWQSPELFHSHNRITSLDVGDKHATFREERENVDVKLGRDPVQQLRLQIATVAKGKINDTCISGIDIHPADPADIVLGADATAAAALAPAFAKSWHAFATCGEIPLPLALERPSLGGGKHFTDAKSVHAACKDGAFASFVHAGGPLHVKSDSPGVAVIGNDNVSWHFKLSGAAWRLDVVSEAR
jgi:hypothetical protein